MRIINEKMLDEFIVFLINEEKSSATVAKYICDIRKFTKFLEEENKGEAELTKNHVLAFKDYLLNKCNYKIKSINSFIIALNRFFDFTGWNDLQIKTFKIQRESFRPENKQLRKNEYSRLVKVARKKGNFRLALIIQTICCTGIRISELKEITVSGAKNNSIQIN